MSPELHPKPELSNILPFNGGASQGSSLKKSSFLYSSHYTPTSLPQYIHLSRWSQGRRTLALKSYSLSIGVCSDSKYHQDSHHVMVNGRSELETKGFKNLSQNIPIPKHHSSISIQFHLTKNMKNYIDIKDNMVS